MLNYRILSWLLIMALLAVLPPACDSQDVQGFPNSGNSQAENVAAAAQAQTNFFSSNRGLLPDLFKGHWVGSISAGEYAQNGILNGASADTNRYRTYSMLSGSLAYDLQKKRSEYMFDYNVGFRKYNGGLSGLDKITQDFGLTQMVQLGSRTAWHLSDRFSMTPDWSQPLIGESLAQAASFTNPVPSNGVGDLAGLPSPFSPSLSPADQLLTVRSTRITNTTLASLSHELSAHWNLSIQAGYNFQRFQDSTLFGADRYNVGTSASYLLSPRTTLGVGYQGTRMDLRTISARTQSQGPSFQLTRQLGERSVINLQGGPAWIATQGQQSVPLPPILASLLGTPILTQAASRQFVSWIANGSFATTFHNSNFTLSYDRSVGGTAGLAGSALMQTAQASLGKRFGQRTSASVGIFYTRSDLLGIGTGIKLDQKGATASISRQVTQALDFNLILTGSKMLRGRNGPKVLNYVMAGVQIVYHFPRITGT